LSQSGRVWQNRFFSCVVESNQYLWAVARYIECNPVKVNMVATAGKYPWSSAKAHLMKKNDALLANPSWLEADEHSSYVDYVVGRSKQLNYMFLLH